MKRKINTIVQPHLAVLLAFGIIMLTLTGCRSSSGSSGQSSGGWEPISEEEMAGYAQPAKTSSSGSTADAKPDTPAGQDAAAGGQPAKTSPASVDNFYSSLQNVYFYFSSGAGGWFTELYIKEDGSFEGHFQDSEMGSTGEGYPHGSLYYTDFTGRFGELKKVNAYTYSTTIEQLEYSRPFEEEEIKDEIRYIYYNAYGLEDAETIYFYTPDAPVAELPEGFIMWVRMTMNYEERKELGFYGLYNEHADCGFSGTVRSNETENNAESGADRIRNALIETEAKSTELEEELQSDIPQIQMNMTSGELYNLWDDLLNDIWAYLKDTLDEDTMKSLTREQTQWIKDKEAAVEKEAEPYRDGSIYQLIANRTAADITRDRVYELIEYVK